MQDNRYGKLLTPDIKIHRKYFEEMTNLLGIQVIYRAPRPDKHYTNYGEIDSNYYEPVAVGCIFDEHPTQQTLKKIGWASELQANASIIHVPYDLPELQKGALFIVPSGIDNSIGRVFTVSKLSTSLVYPASVMCEIVPEYENTFSKSQHNHAHSNFNLLSNEEVNSQDA